ncbi:hypothetical protein [Nocardia blacklockiae]|uniref:hypothetical protein n=1 Tax=Nocardia blacklockiae TaxID=480036 RepID=UPI001895DC85|nr:hypothetical protein [Nocardia blacklockiae]MBF6172410.1 hypothetical protein [Nocardia blacklockiae]
MNYRQIPRTAAEAVRFRSRELVRRGVEAAARQRLRLSDTNPAARVRFPQLPVTEQWPTGRPLFVVVPLAGLLAGIAATSFVCGVAVISHRATEPLVVTAGGAGLGLASLGMLAVALGMLREAVPLSSLVFGLPVRRCADLERGVGVRISQPTRIVPLVSILLGLTVFGQACWRAHRDRVGDAFPFSALDDDRATAAGAVSVVLFIGLVLVLLAARRRIHVELYPSGIVRRNPLRDLRAKDRFLPWEDIAGVESRTQYVAFYLREGHTIVLRLKDSATPPTNRLFDRIGDFGIPAYLARCDSNVLLALLEYLVEEPAARRLLAAEGVQKWFAPHYHFPARPAALELESAAAPQ